MIQIQQDEYILGQSSSKTIVNGSDEISINLELNVTTKYSPVLYDFFVQDIGSPSQYLASNCTLGNGAAINSEGYVQNIGGTSGGFVTINISNAIAGAYILNLQYLSRDYDPKLKFLTNNINDSGYYTLSKTKTWNASDYKVFNIQVQLNSGTNTIKIFNELSQYGPWLNQLKLSQIIYRSRYTSTDVTLGGGAQVANNWILNICENFGYIIFSVYAPQTKNYEILIRYLNQGYVDRYSNIDINGIKINEIYNFISTNVGGTSILLYRKLIAPLNQGSNSIKIYNS